MTTKGGCLCGAVRYEVTADPSRVDYCHCRMCQRASGSVVTTWAEFNEREFVCTKGRIQYHQSSCYAERGFCAQCGSSLVARPLAGGKVEVMTGSFDDPEAFQPNGVHCGIESQMSWLKIDDELPRKTTREVMGFEVED